MKKIRNFAILAHIDHGKSTLADRFLEITQTVPKEKIAPQYLDRLTVEREKGITVKLSPVRMDYKGYVLNLIDTPGHVDFSYEVSRSLACVEGAILLVDGTKGIQAQTISNFYLAKNENLSLIPVINKIDLPQAEVEEVAQDLIYSFGFGREELIFVSAKLGSGVENVLDAVIEKIPPPVGDSSLPLRALIFDSFFDSFKGVVGMIRVFDGSLRTGDKIKMIGTEASNQIKEVGIFNPDLKPKADLVAGEIGFIETGLKEIALTKVGDTITNVDKPTDAPLKGFKEIKPYVYVGIYPTSQEDFTNLKSSLEKLSLNDASLSVTFESSLALGAGFRCGFLGMLHFEVTLERLEGEFNLDLICTPPNVEYKVIVLGKDAKGEEILVDSPASFPETQKILKVLEPTLSAKVITPSGYLGLVSELIHLKRGKVKETVSLGDNLIFEFEIPLSELIFEFYDHLKAKTSGFASLDYEVLGFQEVKVEKIDILVSGEKIDALSIISPKETSYKAGKKLVEKLKMVLPRSQFEITIQAKVGGRIIASEKVPSYRKDVLAKLYGGDRTRKDKLLEKQKLGKKKMKMLGKIEVPKEVFLKLLKI
ncbi:MAG: elongation factor 4 [Candidatus Woykebacteria bacterium RBG_13_40_7b]|uniref:Elongation factor 4 n=1 Tax=Candidatus Woykebacteria bacterium RBG_13_40_7b TaxID=1802594 RepID=A0A1G1WBR4_9BACT|nr:MAG: elongation factor 4 [Candidatus Woykebacteria bacterium RBG_13_40_7b]